MADPNPYQSPAGPVETTRPVRKRRIWPLVLMIILAFPAAGVACFATCSLVALGRLEWVETGFFVGLVVGAVLFGLMVRLGYKLTKPPAT